MSYLTDNDDYQRPETKWLQDGKIIKYNACSSGDLEESKVAYQNAFTYIGSGYTYYINGVENVSQRLHHFFI